MSKQAIIIVFSILVAFGLLCGLLYSINQDLNSDSVVPGIVAMEIFQHGNIQFNYPADDSYLFTDICPFYLVTQFLSGYNPLVLKLTAYLIFLLTVAVFSFIVYKYSGLINALIFAALLVNVNPTVYTIFITPEYHVGTLLAAGVMIYIFDFGRVKNISIYRMLAYAIFVALIVLSDSLIIVTFLIPYAICYLLFYLNQLKRSILKIKTETSKAKDVVVWSSKDIKNITLMMALMVIVPGIAWLFKTFEPKSLYQYIWFIPHPTDFIGFDQGFLVGIPLYLQDLVFIVSQGVYSFLTVNFSIWDIAAAIVFLAILAYAILRRNAHANYLYTMLLLSGVVTFFGFAFLDRAMDGLDAARFLGLTAVSIFIVIALSFNESAGVKVHNINLNTIFLVAVFILLLTMIPANLQKVMSLDYQPNKADYDLISNLEANNITQGYSDYWHSNLLTYLSGGNLQIRAIEFAPDSSQIELYNWLGSDRWYKTIYPNPIVIADKNDEFNNEMEALVNSQIKNHTPPEKITYYKDYVIYKLLILS
jgi:hypothetical protein